MQNLQTNVGGTERDTTSIQLFHVIVMVYDGRCIHHATSVPVHNHYKKWGRFMVLQNLDCTFTL